MNPSDSSRISPSQSNVSRIRSSYENIVAHIGSTGSAVFEMNGSSWFSLGDPWTSDTGGKPLLMTESYGLDSAASGSTGDIVWRIVNAFDKHQYYGFIATGIGFTAAVFLFDVLTSSYACYCFIKQIPRPKVGGMGTTASLTMVSPQQRSLFILSIFAGL